MKTSRLTPRKLSIVINSLKTKKIKPKSWIWAGSSAPIIKKLDEAQILFIEIYDKPSKQIQKARESVIDSMFKRFKI